MKPWTAPLIIAAITIPTSFLLGEPSAALLWAVISITGYRLNKGAN